MNGRGLDNVLVSDRCVSTDQKVHGSLRVMPAPMAAQQKISTHQVDVKDRQQRLKKFGAYLPNT